MAPDRGIVEGSEATSADKAAEVEQEAGDPDRKIMEGVLTIRR